MALWCLRTITASISRANLTKMILSAAVVLSLLYPHTTAESTAIQKINCYPESPLPSRQDCEKRDCVYDDSPSNGDPACYYHLQNQGYRVSSTNDTATGFRVYLQINSQGPFHKPFKKAIMEVMMLSEEVLRITFDDDEDENRYKVPVKLTLPQGSGRPSNPQYTVNITSSQTVFSFQVVRTDTNTVIWDTGVGGLVLSDQFLQLATRLPSVNVYGLGENLHDSFRHSMNASWTAFARDQPPSFSNGENLYGVHPFYTCVEDHRGNTHGVLLLNSNAQDFTLSPLPMLTYRTTGGVLDFYFFFGPSPEQVIQQYTAAIGRPMMPPYWALGFQLSRYGYNHIGEMKDAVESTRKYSIPHDVQYADIDYMDERRDFTVDGVNFAGLNDYFHQLQASGMRIIVILDPALISNNTNYEPYDMIKRIDGFVKWPSDITSPPGSADSGDAILGYVWPKGKVAFPDFFKTSTRQAWKELIINLRQNLTFDGLWIDMNEPANFGTNEERPFNWPESVKPYWSLKCPSNEWDDPPYRSGAAYMRDSPGKPARLSDKTICMAAIQGDNSQYRHYNVHSLYGYSQATITQEAAREATGERSVVVTRSTFPGSGHYAGHWLGDNQSKWSHLRQSIIGILEFNLFGIPYIGADICGFFGDASPELCKRWMQLGAFYTFCRNHNAIGVKRQDPGSFGDEVGEMSREAMETRYWLLPYLYTLFHQAHTQGGTVIRPLHHEFPTDSATYNIDRQFLWGPALLISPILEEGQASMTFYTPAGVWYDFFSGHDVTGPRDVTVAVTPTSKPVLLVKGGHVLPLQKPALNTELSRKNPLKLLVALDDQGSASGSLFWDDGVTIDTFERGKYYLAEYNASSTSVSVKVTHNNAVPESTSLTYSDLDIWGVESHVHDVTIRGDNGPVTWAFDWDYEPTTKILKIFNMAAPLAEGFSVSWRRADDSAVSRIDCWPERQGGVDLPDSGKCAGRKCVYQPHPDPSIPDCFFPQENYGYSVDGPWRKTSNGMKVSLSRVGSGPFGYELDNIVFTMEEYGDSIIRLKFDSPNEDRYTVPMQLNLPQRASLTPQYRFEVTSNNTFAFRIVRVSSGAVVFDTSVGGMVFHDQFLQLSTRLASRHVYGMGENVHSTFRRDLWYHTYALFSRDQPARTDDTLSHYRNQYGTHPFFQCVEEDGKAHGVLLLNSDPQDYTFTPLPMLTYRTIGGILDFYVFFGPTPENVIQQYTSAIGRPYMPPYWALGFQLCKYGYNSLDNLKTVVERTKAAGIPHDVQYVDIDHMSGNRDFTLDNDNFKGLPEYFQHLRDNGMRTIIILDPALISNNSGYEPYERLKAVNGFIKWPSTPGYAVPPDSADDDGSMFGYVWPTGKTVFPDYFKPEVKRVWKELVVKHRGKIAFDGLWIDMNEPVVFGTNEEKPFNWPEDAKPYWSLKCPMSKLDDPPYRTGASFNYDTAERRGRLSDKTLCMTAVQGDDSQYRHYDVHNLYGWSQTPPTLDALRSTTAERGVVVTRSTFVGSGHYAGHWLGDNLSSWADLRASIVGILEFNLFGFPYTGADICGHFGSASFELCKRWMQLGAFYTFSRNHNALGNRDQDPGYFNEEVSRVSREAMETRYWLLPYVYTLFHQAANEGGTVIRPLHHEFPTDPKALGNSRQFLWGASLLISPVLEPNVTSLTYYVPKARWFDFYTGREVTPKGGEDRTVPVYSDSRTELLVRGGSILPMQAPARNTSYSRKNPLTLLVALNDNNSEDLVVKARGSLFWDDGVAVGTYETGDYYHANYEATNSSLTVTLTQNNVAEIEFLYYDTIVILGVGARVVSLSVESDGFSTDDDFPFRWTYDSDLQKLTINDAVIPLSTPFTIRWSIITDEEFSRVDCWPERQGRVDLPDTDSCRQRNCVWQPHWHPKVPDCFFPTSNFGYKVDGQFFKSALGQSARLTRLGPGPFGDDWTSVLFSVEEHGNDVLRFKFATEDGSRYEVPKQLDLVNRAATDPKYQFEVTSLDPFSFKVVRKSTGAVLFDTGVGGLVLEDQFLQLSTRLCSPHVYGLGENVHPTFKRDLWYDTYPLFGRDQPTIADDAFKNHYNHYGTHPFYQCVEDDGSAHGVLLLNSNPQDYSFSPLPMLTYRTIGGILDFYMFLGPSPEEVTQQYTGAIGRPYMPPYWALGFQLCKYGYNSLENLKTAVDRTKAAGIPHDVQYADIDHFDERKDFTIDNASFHGLPEYFHKLHEEGMHTIIILDPALVSNNSGYEPYERLKAVNGFIKWPSTPGYTVPPDSADDDGSMLGYVWPRGKTVFPDYFKKAVRQKWKTLIVSHRQRLEFDGLWTDMNEPAVFGTNEERPFNWPEDAKPYWSLKCPVSKLDDPPYRTGAAFSYDTPDRRARLSDKTLCLTAVQGENGQYRHYDVHNLYGWSQATSTLEGLREATQRRGLVVTRSTFVGSGKYCGHWLGDNKSGWSDLRASIVGIQEFNLFGITYTGADICGHFGTASAELCKRWMQLGAFYSFSRNHNAIGNRDQDPGNFDEETRRVAREAMITRYWLLPYLYTLLHFSHIHGSTVLRPVHHEFSTDQAALDLNEQFMWGGGLLISPIVYPNATELTYYLPKGRWYDYYSGSLLTEYGQIYRTIPAQSDTRVQLSVRGGYILPMQQAARNTAFSRRNPMRLMVALDVLDSDGGRAQGHLFWDDGVSIDTYENGTYYLANFAASNKTLSMKIVTNQKVPEIDSLKFGSILILGVIDPGGRHVITVNGAQLPASEFSYIAEKEALTIMKPLPLNRDFVITWT